MRVKSSGPTMKNKKTKRMMCQFRKLFRHRLHFMTHLTRKAGGDPRRMRRETPTHKLNAQATASPKRKPRPQQFREAGREGWQMMLGEGSGSQFLTVNRRILTRSSYHEDGEHCSTERLNSTTSTGHVVMYQQRSVVIPG